MNIPFVDLYAQYLSIKVEIDEAIEKVIKETAFIGGNYVKEFEKKFADSFGVKNCISCANGTDAIYIVLKMLGVGQGDEVITVANSWISTSETIGQTGATPVFVDIEPNFSTIDVSKIESKITSKTKAIIPVHLYGQTADIIRIKEICDKHNLFLIEDCAQSHFAEFEGKYAGTFGLASTFSFYPGKNLGAYGDAGAMATNDDRIAAVCRMIANHGQQGKHNHIMEGRNSRLDGLQAAVLSAKLPHLQQWTLLRQQHAQQFTSLLQHPSVVTPQVRASGAHVFHLYVVQVPDRTQLAQRLKEKGIETAVHYPVALPFLTCYQQYQHTAEQFPVAASFQHKIISLPMYAELTTEAIAYISEQVKQSV